MASKVDYVWRRIYGGERMHLRPSRSGGRSLCGLKDRVWVSSREYLAKLEWRMATKCKHCENFAKKFPHINVVDSAPSTF
jgi:hypothetical protein